MILLIAASVAAINPCEAAGTQAESTRCPWKQFQRADRELNVQVQRSLTEAEERNRGDRDNPATKYDRKPSCTEALREAQRTWIEFRDLHYTVEGYWGRGGTIELMLRNFYLARMTRETTEQLRKMWHRR